MKAPDVYFEGRPSWVDLATSDPEAAEAFYTALFGWTYDTTFGEPDGSGYHMATNRGHVVAGLAKGQSPSLLPMWTTYLAVDSVAATAAKVRAAGGSVIVEPMTVGPAGRMAYIADPAGATCGLWEGHAHEGAARINEPGAYTWAELLVSDADAAASFYNAIVGLKAEAADVEGGARPYLVFKVGDRIVAGATAPPTAGGPNQWQVYFGAANADATADAAVAHGGEVVAGPLDTPAGRMATITDPQGAVFSVVTLADWPEALSG